MKLSEIANMVKSIGLPYAYHHFPEGTGQDTPFVCFYYPQSLDLYADNINYQRINQLTVELYTDNKDFDNEQNVEAALTAAGLVWSKEEFYIDEERMYLSSYTTEVLIDGEQ